MSYRRLVNLGAFGTVCFEMLSALCFAQAAGPISFASPDGHVQLRLSLGEEGRLQYAVVFREKSVIETSAIGITVDGVNLSEGVQIGRIDRYQVNETYPWYGGHQRDQCQDRSRGSLIPGARNLCLHAYAGYLRAHGG